MNRELSKKRIDSSGGITTAKKEREYKTFYFIRLSSREDPCYMHYNDGKMSKEDCLKDMDELYKAIGIHALIDVSKFESKRKEAVRKGYRLEVLKDYSDHAKPDGFINDTWAFLDALKFIKEKKCPSYLKKFLDLDDLLDEVIEPVNSWRHKN